MPQLQPGMARIRVKDLCLRTFIGINEDEILNKQDVLINLTILYAAQDAVRDNDIDHALNYRTITKAIIAHVEGNRFALLERLTQELLDLIMVNESVLYAEVEVDKPHALRFAESVSNTLAASRCPRLAHRSPGFYHPRHDLIAQSPS
jgi:D-erythro-7,8-dihydroneopterin triphosphate epimerase